MFDIHIIDKTDNLEAYKNVFCCQYLANDQYIMETLISNALDTSEGREELATLMVGPIRCARDYQSLGRRLLMIDLLPQSSTISYQSHSINNVANYP